MSNKTDSLPADLQRNVQPPVALLAASEELPPIDPDLFERAKAVITSSRSSRGADGRATGFSALAMKDGLRALRLTEHPDIRAWHEERVAAIVSDRGGESELSALELATIRETARVEVILAALGDELLSHGVLTGKGKTRSATAVYLKTLDRFVKLTSALGLARKARPVPSIQQYLEQRAHTSDGGTDDERQQ